MSSQQPEQVDLKSITDESWGEYLKYVKSLNKKVEASNNKALREYLKEFDRVRDMEKALSGRDEAEYEQAMEVYRKEREAYDALSFFSRMFTAAPVEPTRKWSPYISIPLGNPTFEDRIEPTVEDYLTWKLRKKGKG